MMMVRRALLAGLMLSSAFFGWASSSAANSPIFEAGEARNCDASSFRDAKWVGPPAPEAVQAIESIVATVGLNRNFEIRAAEFDRSPTATATNCQKMRFILYDRERFDWRNGRVSWADIGILAHEIGHHLQGHTILPGGSTPPIELEADRFAGFAVSRLGGTLEQALSWTPLVSSKGSKTHPPRADRIAAVKAGWEHGEARKKLEGAPCRREWLSEILDVDGRSCRMARVCRGGRPLSRLACEGYDGQWIWQDSSPGHSRQR